MKKTLYAAASLLLIINLTACNISPVNMETLDADKSYADFEGVNIRTGDPAPAFILPDAAGKDISLLDFKDKKNILLLFYRGEWCPYCVDQLDNYQTLLPELNKYNIQLIAISPDDVATTNNTQRRFGQSYLFLSDKSLEVTRQYGIGNAKNLPHPALFLIDKKGKLKWYYASTNHKVRPTADQVEQIIEEIFSKQ